MKQSMHSSFLEIDNTQERKSQEHLNIDDNSEPKVPETDGLQQHKLDLNTKYRKPSITQGSARRGSEMGRMLNVALGVSKFKNSFKNKSSGKSNN